MIRRFCTIILFLFSISIYGQILDPVTWEFLRRDISGSEIELQFKANIEKHWHLYSQFIAEDGPVATSFIFHESSFFKKDGKTLEGNAIEEYEPVSVRVTIPCL